MVKSGLAFLIGTDDDDDVDDDDDDNDISGKKFPSRKKYSKSPLCFLKKNIKT